MCGTSSLTPQPPPPPPSLPPSSPSEPRLGVHDLTEARAFLGFEARTTHPTAYRYLLGTVAGHAIIDPEETLYALRRVLHFLKRVAFSGGRMLFISTRPTLQRLTRVVGQQSGQFYLSKRWVPGLLTNWDVGRHHVHQTLALKEKAERTGRLRHSDVQKSLAFVGIENMEALPDVIVVLDDTRLHGEPGCASPRAPHICSAVHHRPPPTLAGCSTFPWWAWWTPTARIGCAATVCRRNHASARQRSRTIVAGARLPDSSQPELVAVPPHVRAPPRARRARRDRAAHRARALSHQPRERRRVAGPPRSARRRTTSWHFPSAE
jgi:ribosomal protein S2